MTALLWFGLGAMSGGWIVAHLITAMRGIEHDPIWRGTTDE
jgi:hypothetical protein